MDVPGAEPGGVLATYACGTIGSREQFIPTLAINMSKPDETKLPDTPTTDHALPPEGGTTRGPRTGSVAVPGPSSLAAERVTASRPTPPERPSRPAGDVTIGSDAPVGNGRPGEPAELRREIAATRARMSSTLDTLEARLVREQASLERKKTELVDLATLKPVREKLAREPWRSIAIAFVAGYVVAAIRD